MVSFSLLVIIPIYSAKKRVKKPVHSYFTFYLEQRYFYSSPPSLVVLYMYIIQLLEENWIGYQGIKLGILGVHLFSYFMYE